MSESAGGPANIFEAARRGRDFRPRAPCQACEERPGSRAKIEVLRERLEAGEELWGDGDNKGEGQTPVSSRTDGPKRGFVEG